VSASVNLPLHHKVQKFSGTGSPGWSWKKGRKTAVMCGGKCFNCLQCYCLPCVYMSRHLQMFSCSACTAYSHSFYTALLLQLFTTRTDIVIRGSVIQHLLSVLHIKPCSVYQSTLALACLMWLILSDNNDLNVAITSELVTL